MSTQIHETLEPARCHSAVDPEAILRLGLSKSQKDPL